MGAGRVIVKKKRSRSKSLVRAAKRLRQNQDPGPARQRDYQQPFFSLSAASFEAYYLKQKIVPQQEWDEFLDTLQQPLPITFRFNTSQSASPAVTAAKAEARHLLTPESEICDDYGNYLPAPTPIPWVDGWQLGIERGALRRSSTQYLQDLRKWLVHSTNTGVITRQELVSMVPAAVLQVRPQHTVLDLCAAPGSKTTQLLELIHSQEPSASACVVANDSDAVRSYTLSARCGSLGRLCSRLVVALHPAQRFPNLLPPKTSKHSKQKQADEDITDYPAGTFDRVLCDVPCSGDGTVRKHPEVWKRWGPGLAIKHHCLQVQIALRGAAVLKSGGLMTYSTCSLSPVEDEASVAEILRRANGALELVDTSEALPDLASSPGLRYWQVCDDAMTEWFKDYQASQGSHVPRLVRRAFRSSMWPPTDAEARQMRLQRCIRILPHHQDCGGFFVALLRKVKPFSRPSPQWTPRLPSENFHHLAGGHEENGRYMHLSYRPLPAEHLRALRSALDLTEAFVTEMGPQLWCKHTTPDSAPKHIWLIPPAVQQRVCQAVNVVTAGIVVFVRRQYRQHMPSLGYEATGDGVQLISQYAGPKCSRVISIVPEDADALTASGGKPVPAASLSTRAAKTLASMSRGPCILLPRSDKKTSRDRYGKGNGKGKAMAGVVVDGADGPLLLIRKGGNHRKQSLLVAHGD